MREYRHLARIASRVSIENGYHRLYGEENAVA